MHSGGVIWATGDALASNSLSQIHSGLRFDPLGTLGGFPGRPSAAIRPASRQGNCRRHYAGLLSIALAHAEKVRTQFLSLRQLGRSPVFSERTYWQLSPAAAPIFSLGLRTPNRQGRPIFLRMAHSSPKLWTPKIRYGSRNSNVSRSL
jgi:hypothetical protein